MSVSESDLLKDIAKLKAKYKSKKQPIPFNLCSQLDGVWVRAQTAQNKTIALLKELERVLSTRWSDIAGGAHCYTCNPYSSETALCIKIAQFLHQSPPHKGVYQYLMPTVTNRYNRLNGAVIESVSLRHLILSDDKKSLIPCSLLHELTADKGLSELSMPFVNTCNNTDSLQALSFIELAKIIHHNEKNQLQYKLYCTIQRLKANSNAHFKALKSLLKSLSASVHMSISLVGIATFYDYFKSLKESEKKKINTLFKSVYMFDGALTFEEVLVGFITGNKNNWHKLRFRDLVYDILHSHSHLFENAKKLDKILIEYQTFWHKNSLTQKGKSLVNPCTSDLAKILGENNQLGNIIDSLSSLMAQNDISRLGRLIEIPLIRHLATIYPQLFAKAAIQLKDYALLKTCVDKRSDAFQFDAMTIYLVEYSIKILDKKMVEFLLSATHIKRKSILMVSILQQCQSKPLYLYLLRNSPRDENRFLGNYPIFYSAFYHRNWLASTCIYQILNEIWDSSSSEYKENWDFFCYFSSKILHSAIEDSLERNDLVTFKNIINIFSQNESKYLSFFYKKPFSGNFLLDVANNRQWNFINYFIRKCQPFHQEVVCGLQFKEVLLLASIDEQWDVVKIFAQLGFDLGVAPCKGEYRGLTALHVSVLYKNYDVMKLLIDKQCINPNINYGGGVSLIDYVRLREDEVAFKILQNHTINSCPTPNDNLFFSSRSLQNSQPGLDSTHSKKDDYVPWLC